MICLFPYKIMHLKTKPMRDTTTKSYPTIAQGFGIVGLFIPTIDIAIAILYVTE